MRRQPKFPKPAKIPRPRIKDLRECLKGVVSVSLANRIAALASVMQWYDAALPYLAQRKYLLEVPSISKILVNAQKTRKEGIGEVDLQKKEELFIGAIHLFEKAAAKLSPASVDDYYKIFKSREETLSLKKNRMEEKYGEVFRMLQGAAGNRFTITLADAQHPSQYDSHLHSLSYNREAAKKLTEQYRREGLLSVFVDQLDILTKHFALVPDGDGGFHYSEARHLAAIQDLLSLFVAFSRSEQAPKQLVKKGVRVVRTSSGAPRVISKEKVAGRFGVNSSIGIVYQRLADGKAHDRKELFVGLTASGEGCIRHLKWIGNRDKVWTVKNVGEKLQMLFLKEGAA